MDALHPAFTRIVVVIASLCCVVACSPAAPTSSCTDQYGRGETSFNALTVQCAPVGTRLGCQSIATIQGLYVYCPKSQDVTASTMWSSGDAGVARSAGAGLFDGVAIGHTTIGASWNNITAAARPVSIFPGTPPLPTFEISGSVYEAGRPPAAGALDGVVVEIADGLVAGRTATSGVPPPLLPGYVGPLGGPGYYRLIGIPPGTYRLRLTRIGYVPQQAEVTITNGSRGLDFPMQPQ